MVSIKSNINKSLDDLKKVSKKIEKAKVESLGIIAKNAFIELENKYIDSDKMKVGETYKPSSDGNIPKSFNSKNGGKSLSKKMFFNSKKIISRTGELYNSIKQMASFVYDKKGTWVSDDYEVKITSDKMYIYGSDKAAVLERKKTPISGARRIMTKSFRKAITTFKKAFVRIMKNGK